MSKSLIIGVYDVRSKLTCFSNVRNVRIALYSYRIFTYIHTLMRVLLNIFVHILYILFELIKTNG